MLLQMYIEKVAGEVVGHIYLHREVIECFCIICGRHESDMQQMSVSIKLIDSSYVLLKTSMTLASRRRDHGG